MSYIAWIEEKRYKELIAYIKNKNDMGVMPSTGEICKNADMAKATALKYLAVLEAHKIVKRKRIGPTFLWYYTRDKNNEMVTPIISFVTDIVSSAPK